MRILHSAMLCLVLCAISCDASKSVRKSSSEQSDANNTKRSVAVRQKSTKETAPRTSDKEFSLSQFKSTNPVLIVNSMPKHSTVFLRYVTTLHKMKAEFEKHDLVRLDLTADAERKPTAILAVKSQPSKRLSPDEAQKLIDQYGSYSQFKLTLIGKDGEIKLRQTDSADLAEVLKVLKQK